MTTATCGCGAALRDGDCLCPATPLAKLIGRRYALGLLKNRDAARVTCRTLPASSVF